MEGSDEDRHALCSVIVAADPDAAVIELYVDDRLSDAFEAGEAVGEVGQVAMEEDANGVTLTWNEQAPVRSRSYIVQIS